MQLLPGGSGGGRGRSPVIRAPAKGQPVSLPEAFPLHPGRTLCQLKSMQFTVFCTRDVQKHRFFYGVSGPSAARDSILAMLQNLGFGLQEGPGAEKLASSDRFNIDGPNMAPT